LPNHSEKTYFKANSFTDFDSLSRNFLPVQTKVRFKPSNLGQMF
jgi:hypothetical protein